LAKESLAQIEHQTKGLNVKPFVQGEPSGFVGVYTQKLAECWSAGDIKG